MTATWVFVVITLLFITLLSLVIWLTVVILRERRQPTDENININFNTVNDKTGRAIFIEKEMKMINGRWVITGKPWDVDWKKLEDNKEDLEPVHTIINPEHVLTIPKGDWSSDKHIKILLPCNAEDLNERVKDTILGKILAEVIEGRNYQKTVENIIREGSNKKTKFLSKMSDGEVGDALLGVYEKALKQLSDVTKDRMKSSGVPGMPPAGLKP